MPHPFTLEIMVDFVDDALAARRPIEAKHIEALFQLYRELGVTRVHWIYYNDARGGWSAPSGDCGSIPLHRYRPTIDALGNPLRVAVEVGHRLGMEVYACFKPYEQGISMVLPEGSPAAKEFGLIKALTGSLPCVDPFVAANPELRIRRLRDGLSDIAPNAPIHAIRLIKGDDAPTRIKKQNLQIWVSEYNYAYQRLDVPFDLKESLEPCISEVRDVQEKLVTAARQVRRVLTISGIELRQKYILITTDFTDGPADFQNAGLRMMEAIGADGRVIPGIFANQQSYLYDAFTRDFRQHGLGFDNGCADDTIRLDEPNASGHAGIIAYCRGRNEFLPAGLCECEPKVREHWLKAVQEILDTGVDGVDFRVENHCMHTDYPDEYGFNEVILAQCDGASGDELPAAVARVRGKAYSDFLRQARAMVAARGKVMRLHLDADWLRPHRPRHRGLAFPAHMDFPWQQWLDEGLADEATLRLYFHPFSMIDNDPVTKEMIARCNSKNIPLVMPRFTFAGPKRFLDQYETLRADKRFAGLQIYESASIYTLDEDGRWQISKGMQELIDGLRARCESHM